MEQVSVVGAVRDFFARPPYGRKVEISEFKDLTEKDKHELRWMLIAEGYDIAPIPEKVENRTPTS